LDLYGVLDFLKIFLPLAGAAFAWFWNERRKRIAEEYERKTEKYAALIDSLQGFYVGVSPTKVDNLKSASFRNLISAGSTARTKSFEPRMRF
jgi:hypothetical protein